MTDLDPTTDPARPCCEPTQAALHRLLDGDPAWDSPEAVAHRAGCVPCREELVLARQMAEVLRPPAAPADLAGRVLGVAIASHRQRRVTRYAGLVGALAAAVLVAVVTFQPRPQTVTEHPTVAAVPRAKDEFVPNSPLGEAVTDARDALVSLSRRTATETRQTSVSLIPNPKLPDMPGGGDGLEPLADAQAGAARSVDPITTSARRAVNLFLRAADPPNKLAVQ